MQLVAEGEEEFFWEDGLPPVQDVLLIFLLARFDQGGVVLRQGDLRPEEERLLLFACQIFKGRGRHQIQKVIPKLNSRITQCRSSHFSGSQPIHC